jgi:hypothetical protein
MTRSLSLAGFVLGAVPLLGLAFLSPGLGTEGAWGYIALAFGLLTLAGLVVSALNNRWFWVLATLQATLLGLVLYEALSDASLYVGT